MYDVTLCRFFIYILVDIGLLLFSISIVVILIENNNRFALHCELICKLCHVKFLRIKMTINYLRVIDVTTTDDMH